MREVGGPPGISKGPEGRPVLQVGITGGLGSGITSQEAAGVGRTLPCIAERVRRRCAHTHTHTPKIQTVDLA